MSQIPFTVSARTAKLIGQENFSNAEGAIIELVKNTYDADSQYCFILFENIGTLNATIYIRHLYTTRHQIVGHNK